MPRVLPTGFYLLLCIGLIAGNILVYQAIFAPHVLKVTVLDIPKGDAMLVHTPEGKTVLVDTGADASILRALGLALPMWQRSIDAVILTSTKASSLGGLPEVENRYHVGTLVHIGDTSAPYGSSFMFGDTRIEIIAPGVLTVSYGAASFKISSTTPKGVYTSDGKTITKN